MTPNFFNAQCDGCCLYFSVSEDAMRVRDFSGEILEYMYGKQNVDQKQGKETQKPTPPKTSAVKSVCI